MVKVLPEPVTPSSTWSRSCSSTPATSSAMAVGWSPAGSYSDTSLKRDAAFATSRAARGRCGMNSGMVPETSGCVGDHRLLAAAPRVARSERSCGLGQQRVERTPSCLPTLRDGRGPVLRSAGRVGEAARRNEGRLWRLGEGAGLRRAAGGLSRRRGRLAGFAARGARLRGRIGLGLRGAGHAPNMACAALPLKPAASAVGRPAGALRAACARLPGRNPSRCPRSGPHRPASP